MTGRIMLLHKIDRLPELPVKEQIVLFRETRLHKSALRPIV
jgi:hypothetical protein